MNIGLIAHDSKKKLMQNFVLLTEASSTRISYLQREQQGVLLKKQLILAFTSFSQDILAVTSSFALRLNIII